MNFEYTTYYLVAAFTMLAWHAWIDRACLRGAFLTSLFWPLSLAYIVFVLAGVLLRRLGFRAEVSHLLVPRWAYGRMAFNGKLQFGFYVACPWFAVGVCWEPNDAVV